MTFMARTAMGMPRLTKKQMQFWIDNPKKLKAVLKALEIIELDYLHDTVIEVRPVGDTFDPIELLLDHSKVKLEPGTRNLLSNHTWSLGSFIDSVNYMLTKRGATNANVRTDLPEEHLFTVDSAVKYVLIANLIKNNELYGGIIGLSPNTSNVLYFASLSGDVYVIEIRRLESGVWEILQHNYETDKAHKYQFSWPAGTRIYFPSSK